MRAGQLFFGFVLLLLSCHAATAQSLGTAFTFQGALKDAGQAAQGSHDFEFNLYAAASGGSSLTAVLSRPAVAVADGVFNVSLDFGGQFAGAQRWLEIRVRRTGGGTFTALAPRQAVSPVPYAQHADMVSANSIIGANIVNRTINSTHIAVGAVGSTELADGSVTNLKIADGAVGGSKLASFSVNSSKVDPAQIQLRINSVCSRGTPMLGVTESGEVICDQPLRVGSSGQFAYERVSVAIRSDGRPLVAYAGPTLMDCDNVDCTSWTTRTLPGALNAAGVSLAIRSDGLPVIAYGADFSNGLYLYICSNSSCTAGSNVALDTSGSAAVFPSLALRPDNTPLVAYYHWGNGGTQLFVCNVVACNTGGLIRNLNSGVTPRSLRIKPNGSPVLALRDFNNSQSRLVDCNDASCSSASIRVLSSVSSLRHSLSIGVRSDNRPMVAAYHQDFSASPPSRLAAHNCGDAGCANNEHFLLDEAIVYGSDTCGVLLRLSYGNRAQRIGRRHSVATPRRRVIWQRI